MSEHPFETPFPPQTIVSPLYLGYHDFSYLPKFGDYRAFFVVRDPRDLVVSWYFSTRDNHIVGGQGQPLVLARQALNQLSVADGLRYAIDFWAESGRFEALRSWTTAATKDARVQIVRFEDLSGPDAHSAFRRLFDFMLIPLPDEDLICLLDAFRFRRLTGRQPGQENPRSHLRSGTGGTWIKHFDGSLIDFLGDRTGDLIQVLGYDTAE